MAVSGVFEEWFDGLLEVDSALGALEEECGVFIGQTGEELSGIGGFSERSDSATVLAGSWSEELLGQVADGDNVVKLLWVA